MRIWCLSILSLDPYNEEQQVGFHISPGLELTSEYYHSEGMVKGFERSFQNAEKYVLSEIRIGKREKNRFYFVLCREGIKCINMMMRRKRLVIQPRIDRNTDVIDIDVNTKAYDRPIIGGHAIKSIRIRAIKNTSVRCKLSEKEAKAYKEYLERINLYVEKHAKEGHYYDKYEEAFQRCGPLNIENMGSKRLEQKITDLCTAINNLCNLSEEELKSILPKARYNNRLYGNENLLYFPSNYHNRSDDKTDFFGCRILGFFAVNLPKINEQWFLAGALCTLIFDQIDVFKNADSWTIFGNNIGALQHLNLLRISNCQLTEFPDQVLKNLPQSLLSLMLYNNNLQRISPAICRLVNLHTLSLMNNPNLSDEGIPWEFLPEYLWRLELDNTSITKIPMEVGRLKYLSILTAKTPSLQEISWESITHGLEKLSVSNIDVVQTPKSHNISIHAFSLNNSVVDTGTDISLPNQIREIDLSNNRMRYCNVDFFELPYSLLTVIILNNNQIDFMKWISLPPTLTILDLSKNFLTEVGSVKHLTNLTKIELKNNRINKISNEFNQLQNLRIIDLSRNQLSMLPQGFDDIAGRWYLALSLSGNQFSCTANSNLPEELWNRLPKTRQLFLNNMNLKELPCQLAGKIYELTARKCQLTYICPQIYNILSDGRYKRGKENEIQVRLDIADNPELKTFSFIPKTIYPVAMSSEKPSLDHKFGVNLDGNRISPYLRDTPEFSIIISNSKALRKTQVFPTVGRKPVYEFKKVEETETEKRQICKCCAYCKYHNSKNQDTIMTEQLMMMGLVYILIKDESLINRSFFHRPGWQAGKWKGMIRTRLCHACIKKLRDKTDDAFQDMIEENFGIEESKRQKRTPMLAIMPPEPPAPDELPLITINLPYCFPSFDYLTQLCDFHGIPFSRYPYEGFEMYYNTELHGPTDLFVAGINSDETSGFKALSHLLTGNQESFEAIRILLNNHIQQNFLPPNFYNTYSQILPMQSFSLRECDLYATANLFQLNIFVLNFVIDNTWFLINESRFETENCDIYFLSQRPSILMLKKSDDSYDAILAAKH